MSTAIAKNFQIGADGTASNNFTLYQPATPDGTLRLGNGNTGITSSLLTLTSAGNLGLGVTPSAWGSSGNMDFTGGPAIGLGTTSGALTMNAYYNSGWKYKTTNSASYYYQVGGAHQWYTAPSGTAGNAISFTQAMTLDASGRLAIGTTSPIAFSNQTSVTVNGTNNGRFDIKVGDTHTAAFVGGSSAVEVAAITNVPILFAINGSERARIDSSGRFLIKKTSSSFSSNWGTLAVGDSAALVGPSDTNAILCANAYYDGQWKRTNAGYASVLEMLYGGSSVQFFTAGTGSANSSITWTAGPYVANGSNTWTNGSDEKLKNITGEIEDAVSKVMQLRAARYTWKADPENKPQVGLIAQDLQKVLPEVVVEPPEPTDQYGNETYLGVNYDQVIPLLVAAIKEQQAIIEQLKADVAALKGA